MYKCQINLQSKYTLVQVNYTHEKYIIHYVFLGSTFSYICMYIYIYIHSECEDCFYYCS